MLTKIYTGLWAIFLLAAAIIFVTGNFTMFVGVVFGFVAFGMVFMGMMGVLPATVVHPAPATAEAKVEEDPVRAGIADRVKTYKESLTPSGIGLQKPRHP